MSSDPGDEDWKVNVALEICAKSSSSAVLSDARFRIQVFEERITSDALSTWEKVVEEENDTEETEITAETVEQIWKTEFELANIDESFILSVSKWSLCLVAFGDEENKLRGQILVDISPFFSRECKEITVQCTSNSVVPPAGLEHCRIRLSVDKPLLSPQNMNHFNPLSILVAKIRDLPGVRGEKSAFSIQRAYCHPVYACHSWCPSLTKADRGGGRVSRTVGDPKPCVSLRFAPVAVRDFLSHTYISQSKSLRMDFHTTLLAGLFSPVELREWIESTPFLLEVHDRDILEEKEMKEDREKWEQCLETMDVMDVDRMMMEKGLSDSVAAGDSCAHGIAKFRLDPLLNRSQERMQKLMVTHGKAAPEDLSPLPIVVKLQSPVIPAKRRTLPKGGLTLFDIPPDGLSARLPGGYVEAETMASVHLHLYRPIEQQGVDLPPERGLFSRAVYILQYSEAKLYQDLLKAVDTVNAGALQGVALRSYLLTDEQTKSANSGDLDVVCGFQIIDGDYRMVVIEGLVGEGRGLSRVSGLFTRNQRNTDGFKVLFNADVTFSRREYTPFHVSLKIIRLRNNLGSIVRAPDVFDRAKVSGPVFEALEKLFQLRCTTRLVTAKQLCLWPSVSRLLEIERLYGAAVMLKDVDGVFRKKKMLRNAINASLVAGVLAVEHKKEEARVEEEKSRCCLKGPTDHKNEAFENLLKTRTAPDFLATRRAETMQARQEHMQRTAELQLQRQGSEPEPVYMYGNQRCSTRVKMKNELRLKLARDPRATYTYSKDYLSLTVPLIDPHEVEEGEKRRHRERFVSKAGWVYPAPKEKEDYVRHERQVSEARREELACPWEDPIDATASGTMEDSLDATLREAKRAFDTVPMKSKLFGDEDYFKSVHLCGDGLAAEMLAAKEAEKKAWRDKVVVDNTDFFPHVTRGLSQVEKVQGILDGPPRSKGLLNVYNARLPSGKPTAPPVAPPSNTLGVGEAYTHTIPQHLDFRSSTRLKGDISSVLGRTMQGEPLNFRTSIHPKAQLPSTQRAIYKRSISPLKPEEKSGPRWAGGGGGEMK